MIACWFFQALSVLEGMERLFVHLDKILNEQYIAFLAFCSCFLDLCAFKMLVSDRIKELISFGDNSEAEKFPKIPCLFCLCTMYFIYVWNMVYIHYCTSCVSSVYISRKKPQSFLFLFDTMLAQVFCCIVAWIQPDISGCQQNFLVVWRWNQLRKF